MSNSYVRVGEKGLAHALLSPGRVSTVLGDINITINCETAYPFLDTLQYEVTASAPFDFYLRVPAWASSASCVTVGSDLSAPLVPDESTGLHKICLPSGSSTITYTLDSSIKTQSRENDTIAVYKGALLYALEAVSYTHLTLPTKRIV